MTKLICLLAAATTLGAPLTMPSSSPQAPAQVLTKRSWRDEPVKVTKIKVKGRAVKLGESFSEGSDWLRGLTVSVKNTSVGKSIQFIELILDLSERPDDESAPAWTISYGRPLSATAAAGETRPVAPGETVDLVLSGDEYDTLADSLAGSGYRGDINKVEITLAQVVFDDGTIWSAGKLWRKDPDDPDKLKPVARATRGRSALAGIEDASAPAAGVAPRPPITRIKFRPSVRREARKPTASPNPACGAVVNETVAHCGVT